MRHINVEDLDEKTFLEFKKRFDENYKVRFGAEDITIPENTRVIIDGDVIIFEPKIPKGLEVSKWYVSDYATFLIVSQEEDDDGFRIVGFKNINAEWFCNDGISPTYNCNSTDQKEVTSLLIGEAEKNYPKGARLKSTQTGEEGVSTGKFTLSGPDLYTTEDWDHEVFDSKTGKWAEIIPEKKPLYTNSYETEFYNDSNYSYVNKDTLVILDSVSFGKNCNNPKEDDTYSQVMTKPECYRWIWNNWDELNKNK